VVVVEAIIQVHLVPMVVEGVEVVPEVIENLQEQLVVIQLLL
jgi:hypothetical protein